MEIFAVSQLFFFLLLCGISMLIGVLFESENCVNLIK